MTAICNLCRDPATLSNSHIIPEFLYKPLYDQKHRAILADRDFQSKHFIQKGIREYLLCRRCEGKLGKIERRVSRFWSLPDKPTVPVHPFNLDSYTDLKILLLAILWRSSIATGPLFSAVRLGDHEEVVRNRLLCDEPGPSSDFPVIGHLRSPTQSGHEFERRRTLGRRKADSDSSEGGQNEAVVGTVSAIVGQVSAFVGIGPGGFVIAADSWSRN